MSSRHTHTHAWSGQGQRRLAPVPVVEVDVYLDGVVIEVGLQQSGLGLLHVSAEEQHVCETRVSRRQVLYEVDVLHFINLPETKTSVKETERSL